MLLHVMLTIFAVLQVTFAQAPLSSASTSSPLSYITQTFYSCTPIRKTRSVEPTTPRTTAAPNPTAGVNPNPNINININIFVTTYIVIFQAICPTGLTAATYTVTESCPGGEENYVSPTGAPPGFTITERLCTACPVPPGQVGVNGEAGGFGVMVTITEPMNPAAQQTANPQPAMNPPQTMGPHQTMNPQQNSNGTNPRPTGDGIERSEGTKDTMVWSVLVTSVLIVVTILILL